MENLLCSMTLIPKWQKKYTKHTGELQPVPVKTTKIQSSFIIHKCDSNKIQSAKKKEWKVLLHKIKPQLLHKKHEWVIKQCDLIY